MSEQRSSEEIVKHYNIELRGSGGMGWPTITPIESPSGQWVLGIDHERCVESQARKIAELERDLLAAQFAPTVSMSELIDESCLNKCQDCECKGCERLLYAIGALERRATRQIQNDELRREARLSSRDLECEKHLRNVLEAFYGEFKQSQRSVGMQFAMPPRVEDASAYLEIRAPVETVDRRCDCIPLMPRPWKYCQDCGGQISAETIDRRCESCHDLLEPSRESNVCAKCREQSEGESECRCACACGYHNKSEPHYCNQFSDEKDILDIPDFLRRGKD